MKKLKPRPQEIIIEQDILMDQDDIKKSLSRLKTFKEIRIVFFGTPEFSAYILEQLIKTLEEKSDPKYLVQTLITSPDKPVGRSQTLTSSPVSLVGQKYGIPSLKPPKLDSDFIKSHLPELESDLFIVASYGKIIPQELLDIPTLGSINVHPSLLPKYRGASPIQSAILNGDKQTGVIIMLMDEQMDHGPTLSTQKIAISDKDTFESLSIKTSQLGAKLLIETLDKFVKGKIKPKIQDHSKAAFCKLIKKEDGYFDIDNPPSPEKLDRMIRAYYPWPNVWTTWKGKIIKFYPGGKVQMEGKKSTPLKNFLQGYPDFPIRL